jgi:predicted glycosyltransferase
MKSFRLSGKGLFVFSDPGGAKPLLAAIKLNHGLKEYLVVSDRVYDFFDDFGIPVTSCTEGSEEELIQKFRPDFVFTGTSYTSSIELRFIKAAKKLKTQSYAFVDHYTNFLGRFHFENKLVYPDTICVLDNKAKSIAIIHQLEAAVTITGNFYHEYLKSWEASVTKKDFFSKFNIPAENKIIVFAPDPLTNVGGEKIFGFDEMTVWIEIKEAFEHITHTNYTLFIKLHPNQNQEAFKAVIEKCKTKNVIFANQMHTSTLLFYADLVIGMFSNILIESLLLGTPIVRYLKGLKKEDPFAERGVGLVVNSKEQLIPLITKIF